MLRSRKNVVRSGGKKGFTLVELLIVIVVIGVLSAMMMLSSTEAVSSAKASNIISNLRNLKTAVLSWYTDNLDRVVIENKKSCKIKLDTGATQYLTAYVNANAKEFTKYLNNEDINVKAAKGSTLAVGDYIIDGKDEGQLWVVGYYIGKDSRVKEKLASRAASIGLLNGVSDNTDLKIADLPKSMYTNGDFVFLEVQRTLVK